MSMGSQALVTSIPDVQTLTVDRTLVIRVMRDVGPSRIGASTNSRTLQLRRTSELRARFSRGFVGIFGRRANPRMLILTLRQRGELDVPATRSVRLHQRLLVPRPAVRFLCMHGCSTYISILLRAFRWDDIPRRKDHALSRCSYR